jgi:hypothetical protein
MRHNLKKLFILIILSYLLAACGQIVATESVNTTPPTDLPLVDGVQEVQGVVISGGDTSQPGLMDAPRVFIYQVRLDSGEEIAVSFTAYPPGPESNSRPEIRLDFHGGEIVAGDYLIARGTYDQETKTLTVAAEGDFIETFKEKP